jgi:hypothetical protein
MDGSMKFDKVKVGKILSDIRKYLRDLEEQEIRTSEDLRRQVLLLLYVGFFSREFCNRFRE